MDAGGPDFDVDGIDAAGLISPRRLDDAVVTSRKAVGHVSEPSDWIGPRPAAIGYVPRGSVAAF